MACVWDKKRPFCVGEWIILRKVWWFVGNVVFLQRKNNEDMEAVTFTPAQVHVLNMASRMKTERSLERLQEQLAKFYAELVDQEMEELWESGAWNEQKLEELRHAHLRTSYK